MKIRGFVSGRQPLGLQRAAHETLSQDIQRNDCKAYCNNQSVYFSDAFPTANPNLIVQTYGMESRPETVTEVKPQGPYPNDVNKSHHRVGELVDNQFIGIFSRSSPDKMLQLHLRPEIEQMDNDNPQYDYTEYQHVARLPGGRFRQILHGITHVSASFPVIQGDDESIKDMNNESQCQHRHHNPDKDIRIHEFAHGIISTFSAEDG